MGLIVFLSSCQKDNFEGGVDQEIAKSPEMEEYIIAASVFKESLNIFNEEIKKVDFSKLEIVTEPDGRKVIHLSEAIRSIHIERKAMIMNEKKEALLQKYPQLALENLETKYGYINYCVKKSVKVNNNFLERGIIINLPLTKSGETEFTGGYDDMMSYLSYWVSTTNVEAVIYVYSGGQTEVVSGISSNAAAISLRYDRPTQTATHNGRPLLYIAHTHNDNSSPSTQDMNVRNNYPGFPFAIYNNGTMSFY